MRLINVHTLLMQDFMGEDTPEYAILSHTWSTNQDDEVTFNEWTTPNASMKQGYIKIVEACKQAERDGYDYVWCDTVCIAKNSGTELDSALNSMFAWYRDAAVCYAYLSDVFVLEDLQDSRWFTRGWTLQELLAPSQVVFFNCHWELLGNRNSLQAMLTDITGIDRHFLSGSAAALDDAPVGMKLFWLSRRRTTLVEDMAFCMLGIMGVMMPAYYGEGMGAFLRLQQEILRISFDNSIFAWSPELDSVDERASVVPCVHLLATTPAAFANYPQGYTSCQDKIYQHSGFNLDDSGLFFDVDCIPREVPGSDTRHVVALLKDVGQSSHNGTVTMVGINLTWSRQSESWFRDRDQPGLTTVVVDPNHRGTYERLFFTAEDNRNGHASDTGQPS